MDSTTSFPNTGITETENYGPKHITDMIEYVLLETSSKMDDQSVNLRHLSHVYYRM